MATKYIYSDQTGPSLPGGSPLFFRTVTIYDEDSTGKVTNTETIVYYTAKPGGRAGNGDTWTPGSSTSLSGFNPGGFVRVAVTGDKGKTFSVGIPPVPYTQADADAGRIPPGKKVGDPILGATAIQSLTTRGGVLNEAIQNSVINVATKTKPGLAKQLAAKLENTANPDLNDEPDLSQPPVTAPLTSTNEDINKLTNKIISDPRESTVKARLSAINARYPEDISTKQDTILFRLKEIIGRDFTGTQPKDANFTFGTKSLSQPFGSVVLPIQPSITDSNSVDWGNPTLDPLSAFAGRASLAMQTSDQIIQEVGNQAKIAAKEFKTNYGAYASALHLFLAQEAIGAQGLFSRGTGAVLNPNLELLFTGPSLRPFNFTFRLSPRSESEAKIVKQIIYFFKAGMATRRANTAVFLKAPYVFSIQYQTGTSEGLDSHKSLNRIKDCALLSCDVDYTPDGTYMTFNDEEKTITSYQLTLRFSELDPIYNTDYVDSHPIGY